MAEAWIIDACRTPRGIGKKGKGALADEHPQHLGAAVFKALKERVGVDTDEQDDVYEQIEVDDKSDDVSEPAEESEDSEEGEPEAHDDVSEAGDYKQLLKINILATELFNYK